MALTTEQIAKAHATLSEIHTLITIAEKEKEETKKKEYYDKITLLNN